MALSVSPTRHDATLSKTLLEAKHRLGAVYVEARLIECPKNAIELKKLLKNYDKLEKEYVKDVSEVKRNQQMLSLSLTNYLKSDRPSASQEILGQTRAEELSVPLPPGFRYRSNGDPKQLQLKTYPSMGESHLCWQPSVVGKEKSSTIMSTVHAAEGMKRPSTTPSNCGNVAEAPSSNSNQQPQNQRKSLDSCCNSRFAFKPGSINFGKSDGKILRLRKSARSSLRPACSACQFKLKYSDEGLQKMQQYQKEPLLRWQIAPKGRYVKAPFRYSELEKMVSEVQFSARCSRSPSRQSALNSIDVLVAANKPSLLTDPQQTSSLDNRRLASSAAFTSVVRTSSEKRQQRQSPLDDGMCKPEVIPFEQKRSSVSFSPSALANSSVACEPKESSCHAFGHSNPSVDHRYPRCLSDIPGRRHMSVHYWKPLLEEERLRCAYKVGEFLKKLPGDYTPRTKPDSGELLPWARSKGDRG